jgi:hypothetical protein
MILVVTTIVKRHIRHSFHPRSCGASSCESSPKANQMFNLESRTALPFVSGWHLLWCKVGA